MALFVASVVLLGILMFGSSLIAWRAHQDEMRLGKLYSATMETITLTREVEIGALDAIRGERGYIITGQNEYLGPYTRGSQQLRSATSRLRATSTTSPASFGSEAEALQREVDSYLQHLATVIATYRNGGHEQAMSQVATNTARRHIERIDQLVGTIEAKETAQLAAVQRHVVGADYAVKSYLVSTALAAFTLIILACISVVELCRSMQRERVYRDELRLLAQTDELTGLANRREFLAALDRAIASAGRSGTPLAFASFDIDHFKSINDRFGHATGDEVIRKVADLALASVRASDIVGRVGGEEFAIVLPDADRQQALAICERLRTTINGATIMTKNGLSLPVTVSTGLAEFTPGDSVQRLLESADHALYAAKNGGRDQVRLAA